MYPSLALGASFDNVIRLRQMTYYICFVSHSADFPAAAALERAAANIPLPMSVVETAGNTFVAANEAA
jgi:hypothetical protein